MIFESVIRSFFEELENNKIEYCVLRNYECLPEINESNDIDLLLRKENLVSFSSILSDISSIFNFKVILAERHNHGIRVFVYRRNPNLFFKLDLHTDESWKGASYLTADEILCSRISYKCFYIPGPVHEAIVLLLSPLLSGGYVKRKYMDKIKLVISENKDDFVDIMTKIAGEASAMLITRTFELGEIQQLDNKCGFIRKSIWLKTLQRRKFKQVLTSFEFLLFQLQRRLIPRGFLLEIVNDSESDLIYSEFVNFFEGVVSKNYPGLQILVMTNEQFINSLSSRKIVYNALIIYDILIVGKNIVNSTISNLNGICRLIPRKGDCAVVMEKKIIWHDAEYSWREFVENYCDLIICSRPLLFGEQ